MIVFIYTKIFGCPEFAASITLRVVKTKVTPPPSTTQPPEPPQTPEPTEPPKTPEPTEPPKTPEPTEPPKTPEPTEPPKTPEPTEPPKTPEPTEPPKTPEPTEPPKTTQPPSSETTIPPVVAPTVPPKQEETEQYCGDGNCDNNETCTSCPLDCGLCDSYSCFSQYCSLPQCLCAQTSHPSLQQTSQIPQFVAITWDDAQTPTTFESMMRVARESAVFPLLLSSLGT